MKIEIIANPVSGSYDKVKLDNCASILADKFGEVEISHTKCANDATRIAASSNADLIIAAGGDGLLNEVAGGIVDKNVMFAALPFGTVNVFCREHKIPLNPVKAAERLNTHAVKNISLGFLNKRAFLLMCGVGYDAAVVRHVTEKGYKKHKTFAHLKEGLFTLRGDYPALKLTANNVTSKIYHAIISLGHCYAGSFNLSDDIKTTALNLFTLKDNSTSALLKLIVSLALGKGYTGGVIYSDSITINGTTHFQLDGEYIDTGLLENCISIRKSAIRFVA